SSAPAGETADQFVARINAEFKAAYPEMTSAQWLSSTSSAPAGETADQFVARINAEFKAAYPEMTSAQWL
ncbi:hypothetical protein C7E25_25245, partial [Stenotrophomonas maltophilia]